MKKYIGGGVRFPLQLWKGKKMEENRIRKSREALGFSREEFCKIFEIPYSTCMKWELGQRKCPVYLEKLILEKLNEMDKVKTNDIK